MDRRTLLGNAGLGVAGVLAANAFGKEAASAVDPRQAVIDWTTECIKRGESCLAHCADMYENGDVSMAACNKAVQAMLATCNAMLKLASADSDLAAKMASTCIAACEACKKECEKHSSKMKICKACAESCANCIKACLAAYK